MSGGVLRRPWSHEELIIVFNLYCKLPFGRYHARNSEVKQVAEWIGRTPGAVAMKLTNFASFDPLHQQRGVRGLSHTGVADKAVWDEFHNDWNSLVMESEQLVTQFTGQASLTQPISEKTSDIPYIAPTQTEAQRNVTIRIGQEFFRRAVLASYRKQCCICSLPITRLLIASHIVPWKERENTRLDPSNGLCLCTLHDAAFDSGLITVSDDYRVLIGLELKRNLHLPSVERGFGVYLGQTLILPDKFAPHLQYLAWHRDNIWQG